MKLRKLIMSGFKSFADRTELEFDDGISCIVGPNGCGKSNVVDAVKWVLGEQSAKSLRGSAMQDVIFNGSSARKPAGLAEVTLVFDNDQGMLAAPGGDADQPHETLAITRRLYRNGQSEYLINKAPARLKDIREMFLDTGVGASAYSTIEQGRVTQFLQASQEERRAIFDEAAGISKYKARRKEALRKLERVEQNLLRVQDVLEEVEKRLRSIKYQAGKARNYQTYSERLGELRSLHLLAQFHGLTQDRGRLEKQIDQVHDALAQVQARIGQLEAARSSAEVESVDLERTSRELEGQIASVGGQLTSCEQRIEMLTGRVKELGDQIVVSSGKCEGLEAKIERSRQQAAETAAGVEQIDARLTQLTDTHEQLRDRHTQAQLGINDLEQKLDEKQSSLLEAMRAASQVNNDLHRLDVRRENLQAQHDRLVQRREQVGQAADQARQQHQEVTGLAEAAQQRQQQAETHLAQAREQAGQLADSEGKLRGELADAREQRSALRSRVQALEEMHKRLEGVAGGVRKVLQARRDGQLALDVEMLGEKLDSDVAHAPIIEAALAGADQMLLTGATGELASASPQLRDILGDGGAVEVLCIDRVSSPSPAQVPADAGDCVRVADWVRCEDRLRPVVEMLLGRTLVVDSLSDALSVIGRGGGAWRLVTRTGEVVEPDGRIRLGSAGRGSGVIARRSELSSLGRQDEQLAARIEQLQQACQDTHAQREQIEQRQQQLRNEVHEAGTERVRQESRLRQVAEELEKARQEQPLIERELTSLAEEQQQLESDHEQARRRSSQLEADRAELEGQVEAMEADIRGARQDVQKIADEMTEAKVSLAQAQQQRLAITQEAAALKRQAEEMEQDLAETREQIEADRQRRVEAEQAITGAREQIETLYARQKELATEAEDVEESRRTLKERTDEIARQITEERRSSEQRGEQLSQLRVELGEVEVRVENLIARAAEEMSMQLVELYESYEHDEDRDWDAVAAEIGELREKIRRLGNVNLDAIGEQEQLEQRQQFLTGQLDDIRASRNQLDELIRRINTESRALFTETFQAVRENFREMFRKLFGGGKADILLADPEDVLESPIEIVARPPGKELRSLSLLSGGEKTMTALSLLFAIFRSKPSPFCLMDEVDAALDEANVERFSRLLADFSELSQFIVISHAKRTMSAANVLYGVTMQEPGVSKRISVRFESVDEHLEEPVGAGA